MRQHFANGSSLLWGGHPPKALDPRPLVAQLTEYYNGNAPPWFTWFSNQVVCTQGSDTMGLHTHLRDWLPMAPIVCGGGGGLSREDIFGWRVVVC